MGKIKFSARTFSRLGQSGAIFGIAAIDLKDAFPIVCISADMSSTAGLDRFKRVFPDDFFNVGIAEQNMLGVAAGMASEGFRPVCVTQAAFISMRAFEMIRQFMGYMGFPVITVGLSSGFVLSYLGNTHYCIEDLALMRSVPGMWVYSPSDAGSAVKIFEKALELAHPAYIRLTSGLPLPIIYKEDFNYDPLNMVKLKDTGSQAVVFATGSMVYQCLLAHDILEKEGVLCRVYDVSCLKPLDSDTIVANFDCGKMFTVEEHSIMGGLGSAVADVLSQFRSHPELVRIGVNDRFSPVGDYQWLLEQHGLTADQIAQTIKDNI